LKVTLRLTDGPVEIDEPGMWGPPIPRAQSDYHSAALRFVAQHEDGNVQVPAYVKLPRSKKLSADVSVLNYMAQCACHVIPRELARSPAWDYFRRFELNLKYQKRLPKPVPGFEPLGWSKEIELTADGAAVFQKTATKLRDAREFFTAIKDALYNVARDGEFARYGSRSGSLIYYMRQCTDLCDDMMHLWYREKMSSVERIFADLAKRKNRYHPTFVSEADYVRGLIGSIDFPTTFSQEPPAPPSYLREYLKEVQGR
jgi:hypothetical protein